MLGSTILVAVSIVGVDTGWQPNEAGELEYIIQIEPQLLKSLAAGDEMTSEIPAGLHNVRRYRIRIGDETPPRIDLPQPADDAAGPNDAAPPDDALPDGPTIDEAPRYPTGDSPTEPAEPPSVSREPADDRYGSAPGDSRYPTVEPITEPPRTVFGSAPTAEPKDDPLDTTTAPALRPMPAVPELLASYEPADDRKESTEAEPIEAPATNAAAESSPAEPKPWIPFIASLFALVASMGANFYLGLTWWSTRRRYQDLVHERLAT